MAGIEDLYNQATGAVSQAAKDYIVSPVQKVLGIYTPDESPTELPYEYYPHDNIFNTFRRSTQPQDLQKNIPVYKPNEKKGGLETLPQAIFDARSPLKSDVLYWQGGHTGKNGAIEPSNVATPHIQNMYSYARVAGAARQLGLPSMEPDQFAAHTLKEGRDDSGFNGFIAQATPDLKFRAKLDQYNIPEWQKDYLGAMNYADRVAKKRKIPFAAVWNGTGRSVETGKTGFDYAKAMDANYKALEDPKNAEFRAFVHRAYDEGAKYGLPLVKDKQRDTDPYLKSDPQYKYHNPDGTLRKAEGGIVIDHGNPAKRERLI